DTVTREAPAEAFYLFEAETREWFSPTYHPLNDDRAAHEAEFGMGYATFRMARETIETELTLFVPPEEPVGGYLLTVRNQGTVARRLRLAPYFQMVLAGQPEHSGPLKIRRCRVGGETPPNPRPALDALFFVNPRNTFRTGPAFVALSCPVQCVETRRGCFF